MVEDIYALKNKILKHVEKETMNMERIDVMEVGDLIDMVKDLAEAEKSCWEADYYRKVVEAMGQGQQAGYGSGGGTGSSAGYGSSGSRSGYGSQDGGMGYGGRSGYGSSMRQGYDSMGHGDVIEKLGEEYRNLTPDERAMMKNKVLTVLGAM